MGTLDVPPLSLAQARFTSVKDSRFGAVGDGVADDTLAIQSAIDAITAGVLYFPPGTYLVDGDSHTYLDFTSKSNIVVWGPGAMIKRGSSGSGTKYLINLAGSSSNITFLDLQFYSAYTKTQSLILMGSGSVTNCVFDRCHFTIDTWNSAGSQPYIANMTPSAVGGIRNLTWTNCRMENTGVGGFAQVTGLLIRGVYGMTVEDCTFVNINNPIAPDNIFQKIGLVYANNIEIYTTNTINIEGPDVMCWNSVSYTGNTQILNTTGSGTTDLGGCIIDTDQGFGSVGVQVTGNHFEVNPIQVCPRTGAGNSVADCVISGNTIHAMRSTAIVNTGICLYDDPKNDGTTTRIYVGENTIYGTFTGNAIRLPTGYTNVRFGINPGFAGFDPVTATVATQQSTVSTTYTDLTTAGPSAAAVFVPISGRVKVTLTAKLWQDTANNGAYMGIALSGANTLSAADIRSLHTPDQTIRGSASYLITGLTPGSTTFTAKYRAGAATNANFADRSLIVEPLP